MYYLIKDTDIRNRVFIYDDSDKSVELVEREILANNGVETAGNLPFDCIKKGSKDISRLRMLGFSQSGEIGKSIVTYLESTLCIYWVGRINCALHFYIEIDTSVYVMFVAGSPLGGLTDFAFQNLIIERQFDIGFYVKIPIQMLWYLLHLRSKRDFESIMQSFDDLFGNKLDMIYSDACTGEVKNVIWED